MLMSYLSSMSQQVTTTYNQTQMSSQHKTAKKNTKPTQPTQITWEEDGEHTTLEKTQPLIENKETILQTINQKNRTLHYTCNSKILIFFYFLFSVGF